MPLRIHQSTPFQANNIHFGKDGRPSGPIAAPQTPPRWIQLLPPTKPSRSASASPRIPAGFTLMAKKGKGFPYSIPSVGPGADPGVQAVSLQATVSHPPGGRLPLLSARPAVTSPAAEHHRPLAGTKLYCLVTEAHRCKQHAQGCYAALPRAGFEPATY